MFSCYQITVFVLFCSLISMVFSLPTCHDTIPFSVKYSKSPVIIYGDIIEALTPSTLNNSIRTFNITLLVKCTLKGPQPTSEHILIEHLLPDNPICYRTLVNGYTYIFFLNSTYQSNFYQQNSFHELLFNDDTTVEILRRTCDIEAKPFHETDNQCPIVSVGCI